MKAMRRIMEALRVVKAAESIWRSSVERIHQQRNTS